MKSYRNFQHLLTASLLGLLCLFHTTSAYQNGAPDSAEICEKLSPKHGVDPQTSPSPYSVNVNRNSLNGGEKLTITLQAPSESYFKGFLVSVKKAGDAKAPVGKFDISGEQNRTGKSLKCFGLPKSAATHIDGSEKKQVSLDWIAPNEDLSELEVV